MDIYRKVAWERKPEVRELFDNVTPKFLKEAAQRAFIEAGIKDKVPDKDRAIDIYTPSTFTYKEEYSHNSFTSAEYIVYDESHWDPFKVMMSPYEITVTRYDESSHETDTLLSLKGNFALAFYFKKYFDLVITDEEIEAVKKQ